MADNSMEGEPFATVKFNIRRPDGNEHQIEIDVGLNSPLIGGHKQDLAGQLLVEGQVQTWTYNDIILQDEKSLWDYGINGTEPVVITVTVL